MKVDKKLNSIIELFAFRLESVPLLMLTFTTVFILSRILNLKQVQFNYKKHGFKQFIFNEQNL